jgi:16S rRNA (guanine527-N7)-methyltransferase
MDEESHRIGLRLNELLATAGLEPLDPGIGEQFGVYFSLLVRWNARVNLTAIRDEEGILSRHFVESVACARALPAGIDTLLDFGSGAGFPGIPISLCRSEIEVTLAESQGKKAAFLQEAVRTLGIRAAVHAGRAETLGKQFGCVTLRAVDRMHETVEAAGGLVRAGGWLGMMTSGAEFPALQGAAGDRFSWRRPDLLPGSEDRIMALGVCKAGG